MALTYDKYRPWKICKKDDNIAKGRQQGFDTTCELSSEPTEETQVSLMPRMWSTYSCKAPRSNNTNFFSTLWLL